MIDPHTARGAAVLLATAIAETLEDHAGDAARFSAAPAPAEVAISLQAAAEDLCALTAALRVLTRVSAAHENNFIA